MRQAGYLAAAGLYALEHQWERLADDHRRAAEIGALLTSKPYVAYVAPVETNIVIFEVDTEYTTEREMMEALNSRGIRLIGMGQGKLRMVTHMDYTAQMHEYTLSVLDGLELG